MTMMINDPQRGALGVAQSMNSTQSMRRRLQAGMAEMAIELKPKALLTLTVKEPQQSRHNGSGRWLVADDHLVKEVNELMHRVNRKIFGRSYKVRGVGLTGFGCIEKQANHQPHIHLALTNAMSVEELTRIRECIFKNVQKLGLFHVSGTDFRLIRNSFADHRRVGDYLGKDIGKGSHPVGVLALGPEGLH